VHEVIGANLIAHGSRDPARIENTLVPGRAVLVGSVIEPVKDEDAVIVGSEAIDKTVDSFEPGLLQT